MACPGNTFIIHLFTCTLMLTALAAIYMTYMTAIDIIVWSITSLLERHCPPTRGRSFRKCYRLWARQRPRFQHPLKKRRKKKRTSKRWARVRYYPGKFGASELKIDK